MYRIVLNRVVEINQEVLIVGPPLEALRFQGGRRGRILTVTDSQGRDFRGRVLRLAREEAAILIFDAFPLPTESPVEIILLQALPEKERMELIIQKVTELGVSAIVPFKSERSITLDKREAKQKKSHRWQHIAVRAVQQSRRARVPLVGEYRSFREALDYCERGSLKILLWEKEGRKLKEVLRAYGGLNPPFEKGGAGGFEGFSSNRIHAMVGPEGGFAEEEIRMAKEAGFVPVKLGQRILRTETAAITLVGILQYELGDLS